MKEETAGLSRTASQVREDSASLKKVSFAAKDKVAATVATLKQAEVKFYGDFFLVFRERPGRRGQGSSAEYGT